ncbi:MAG TPA: SDR family oxidoreductase [Planctomycetota bacterium]|nr:SDR family oxidoreductase [Planctomycetota bacterium]
MDLRDKTCVVTGASRGIGRALAELIVREGGSVAICGRDPARLRETEAALRKVGGGRVLAVPCDVGQDEAVRRFTDAALDQFKKVDLLVNNAAILAPRSPLKSTPVRTWEEVLRVNVIGTVNMIRRVLPSMEERGEGVIVNLSSGWGREAAGHVASYCASKFAVEAITQSLGEETTGGVIVFALNPGIIGTDMLAAAFEEDISGYPTPEDLGPHWLRLFREVKPSWHGTSRDLQR